MSMTVEYVLASEASWDERELERQQVLRDRLRNSLRSRNPRALVTIDDDVEDVTHAVAG